MEFPQGIFAKKPNDKAPDFIIANISLKRDEAIKFLQEQKEEFVNLQVRNSKGGKYYCMIDDFKPQQPQENLDTEQIPF